MVDSVGHRKQNLKPKLPPPQLRWWSPQHLINLGGPLSDMNCEEVPRMEGSRDFSFVGALGDFPQILGLSLGEHPTSLSISNSFQTEQFFKAS